MKSWIVKATLAIVIVLGVIAVVLLTQLDRLVGRTIETHLEMATGTEADVDGISISHRESRVSVARISIANPPGFASDYALSLENIDVELDVGTLNDAVLVLPRVAVRDATLYAEQKGRSANVVEILERLRASDSASDTEPAEQVIIGSFVLENARIIAIADSLDEPEAITLDPVRIEGIGQPGAPVTYDEAADAVLGAIFSAARAATRGRLGEAARDAAAERVEDAIRDRLDELDD